MSKHTTVYSPEGDMFETSALNAHDLVTHAGWSYEALTGTPAPAPAPEPVVTPPAEEPEADADETTDESEAEETADESDEDETPADEPKVRKTVEDFADLEDRDAVIAYLATAFPDFKPHHLAGRDKLVEKAVELAAE